MIVQSRRTSFPSDLEIARSVTPQPITDVAYDLGFRDDEIELYDRVKAKPTIEGIRRLEADAWLIPFRDLHPAPVRGP